MSALELAAGLVEQFEGFSETPYRDPVGVWTIGFGSTRDMGGHPVSAATPKVSRDEAHALVVRDLEEAQASVRSAVKVPLTDHQEAALIDFVYNLGAGNLRSSTLLRKLNSRDYAGAAAEFPRWDRAGGKELAGLLRRRRTEAALFIQQA